MKLLKITLINTALFLLLLFLAEGVASFLTKDSDLPSMSYSRFYELATKPNFNYRPQGSRHYPKHKGVFDSVYHYKKSFDRVVPQYNNQPTTEFIFMGCSFTFGVGVNDNETLPAYFSEINPEAISLNFGLPSFGPNESLAFLRQFKRKDEVPPSIKEHIGIYTLFNDHVNRSALNLSHLWWSDPRDIIYFEVKEGNLRGGEVLAKENYPLYIWSLFLKTSELAKFFFTLADNDIDRPLGTLFDQHDINLTAKVIKQIEAEFMKRFPNSKFYVFLMETTSPKVIKALKSEEIFILNEDKPFASLKGLPDGHLKPSGNKEMAEFLLDTINATQ